MNQRKATRENEIHRFWDRYVKHLERLDIKSNVARWYVIRAEQYIKAFPDKRLAEHGPDDVRAFLEQQGRTGRIQDWQFRQIVDAIQNLFSMLRVPWQSEVDWKFWMDSAASLTERHPTVVDRTSAKKPLITCPE